LFDLNFLFLFSVFGKPYLHMNIISPFSMNSISINYKTKRTSKSFLSPSLFIQSLVKCNLIGRERKDKRGNSPQIDSFEREYTERLIMPVCYQSLSYLPPITWLPSPATIYQFQRDSTFQYLRQTHHFTSMFFLFILLKTMNLFS
jgi:hypothetical protein